MARGMQAAGSLSDPVAQVVLGRMSIDPSSSLGSCLSEGVPRGMARRAKADDVTASFPGPQNHVE
jgi:hypothetical protein